MKKLVIALMFVVSLTLILVSPVMADGPGNNGQGADPTADPPPNEVWVPSAAYDARGEGDGFPPNPDSNGAMFYWASSGGG